MKITIFLVLSFFFVFRIHAQDISWEDLNDEAKSLYQQGKYDSAIIVAKKALKVAEKKFGPDHIHVALNLNNLALLYKAQNKYEEAEPLYKRALAIAEKTLEPSDPNIVKSLKNLAVLYADQLRYAEAEPLYRRLLSWQEKYLGPDHAELATTLASLSEICNAQGQPEQADLFMRRSFSIAALGYLENEVGPDHLKMAHGLDQLAAQYEAQDQYTQAGLIYKRALAVREKILGSNHADVASNLENLAALYRKTDRKKEAAAMEQRAASIRNNMIAFSEAEIAAAMKVDLEWRQTKKLAEICISHSNENREIFKFIEHLWEVDNLSVTLVADKILPTISPSQKQLFDEEKKKREPNSDPNTSLCNLIFSRMQELMLGLEKVVPDEAKVLLAIFEKDEDLRIAKRNLDLTVGCMKQRYNEGNRVFNEVKAACECRTKAITDNVSDEDIDKWLKALTKTSPDGKLSISKEFLKNANAELLNCN